jgi:cytochrome c biogenesis protein CcdA
MLEFGKVFLLGVLAYVSPCLFFVVGKRWFPELEDRNEWEERIRVMRTRFWKAFGLVSFVVISTLLILYYCGHSMVRDFHWTRIAAVVIALSSTLGRGGWGIATWKNNSIPERIDRGMYTISQLSATVLLLFALSL